MKLESISLRGYRCFDETGQTITLDDLTCFVGPNASGKTAAMLALARMFGETRAQRQIVPSDFHLALGENLTDKSPRVLTIECHLRFPELEAGEDATAAGVPETFNQMIVNEPDGTPYCRIRLEATWTDDGTVSGDIEQRLWWITTSSDDSSTIEQNRIGVKATDRSKIRVVYLGAVRNPSEQIQATGSSFGRILEAVEWNGADVAVKENLTQLQNLIEGIAGVGKLNSELQTAWDGFYDGEIAKAVSFKSGDEDPASLIKNLAAAFSPGEAQPTMEVSQLSDGLRSLFSVALSLGLFRVEELVRSTPAASGFKSELTEKAPIVTVFAIEEPENHLSPQYLGRILNQLIDLSTNARAQIVISSHSPSIMRRVEPDFVRYFLGHELLRASAVKNIPLPEDPADESFKYVREAVRGFPELYFARLVILGEGPSEEIVFRRVFEASGTPLDQHFISVVPLGGRHVNHFWRLLHGLCIPYITVLDLDREKEGAGWGRVQYVRDQLVKRFGVGHPKLEFKDETDVVHSLDDATFDTLRENSDLDTETMAVWLTRFRDQFDAFCLAPLDLDFAMLEQFPDYYKGVIEPGHGPRLPARGSAEYTTTIVQRMRQVLAADATKAPDTLGSSYEPEQQEQFAWYKYLFIDGSKPVTHMLAVSKIEDDRLAREAPECLRQLIARAGWLVKHPSVDA